MPKIGGAARETLRVGATVRLMTNGVYRIATVRHAPDEDHLKLTIE